MIQQNDRPYPDGIAWDEAWRQRQKAEALESRYSWRPMSYTPPFDERCLYKLNGWGIRECIVIAKLTNQGLLFDHGSVLSIDHAVGWMPLPSENEDITNANLAAAAPELLASLKMMLRYFDTFYDRMLPADIAEKVAAVRAIKKAEGRS